MCDLEVRYRVFKDSANVPLESNLVCGQGIEPATSRKRNRVDTNITTAFGILRCIPITYAFEKSVAKTTSSSSAGVEKCYVVCSVDTGTVLG